MGFSVVLVGPKGHRSALGCFFVSSDWCYGNSYVYELVSFSSTSFSMRTDNFTNIGGMVIIMT